MLRQAGRSLIEASRPTAPSTPGLRLKHSSTQIKRRFKNHPARIRVEKRMGIDRTPEPVAPPKFQPVFEPTFLSNGWSAPPTEATPEYPFKVDRTTGKPNGAVGFLPVYSKFRKDGTKAVTQIRRVSGDMDAFLQELRSALDLPERKNPRDEKIRVRSGNTIEVDGHYTSDIKKWLAGLGF